MILGLWGGLGLCVRAAIKVRRCVLGVVGVVGAWTSAALAADTGPFSPENNGALTQWPPPPLPDLFIPRFTPLSVSRIHLIASALPDIIIPHKLQWINHWNRSLAQKSICGKNKATLPSFEWTIIGGENVKSKRQYRGNDAVLDRTLMKCNYGLFACVSKTRV